MIRLAFTITALAGCLFGWNQDEQPNVNSRYTVESVHVTGKHTTRLTATTRREMESVVGQSLDQSLLDRIATRIKKELRVDGVSVHVAKGSQPGQVAVEFTAEGGRRQDFDIDVPKGVYHSRQGWSGGLTTTTSFGANEIGLGIINDGDSSVERFAGLRSHYERGTLGTDRVRLRVDFDSYHSQWNSSTVQAGTRSHFAPDLYRSRQHVAPAVTFVLSEPVTLTVGMSVDVLSPQFGGSGTTLANAAEGALRFRERWATGLVDQNLDAGYTVRAAGAALGSDASYSRHAWNVSYRMKHGHSTVAVDFIAGRITGRAPLYDRFVLGNGSTLRGWNKYDIDPLGGDRVVHGSVDYSYHGLQVFYDTGAIWEARTQADARQSVGVGVGRAGKNGFLLAAAFPLRGGHIDPIFIVGFNF